MAEIQSTTTFGTSHQSLISWRAIFAGVFVSLLSYMILMSLAVAIGGSALQDIMQGDNASAWGWGAGLWLIVATLASLFLGSYAAARVSGSILSRTGAVQGVVITALFFAFMVTQVGSAIGSVGRGMGAVVSAIGGAAGDLSQNPEVRSTIDQAIGDLNLRSSPEDVAQGVAVRLLRGDDEGAKSYLAVQAGITPEEADQRLMNLRDSVQQKASEVGEATSRAVAIAGWSLFGALLLGTLSGFYGGIVGARRRFRDREERTIDEQRVA